MSTSSQPEAGAPRGTVGVVLRALVRLALIALAVLLWQSVALIADGWMVHTPLSPLRGRGVPHGHPNGWGVHHYLGYALLLFSIGCVALMTSVAALASLSREVLDGWLRGIRRRVARENAYRTDGSPRRTGRFQLPVLPEATPEQPDHDDQAPG